MRTLVQETVTINSFGTVLGGSTFTVQGYAINQVGRGPAATYPTIFTVPCSFGWANCDGKAENGCEVNTQTSSSHCGGCGKACAQHQHCQDGACVCDEHWGDCDLTGLGCPTDLLTSNSHCGICGTACTGHLHCNLGACDTCDEGEAEAGAAPPEPFQCMRRRFGSVLVWCTARQPAHAWHGL